MSHAETVQATYEAFGRGDVATILDKLDDAVEGETTVAVSDVPWLRARRGKAHIVGFFASMAPLGFHRFEPHTIFDGGDKIFVLIAFEATALGKRYWSFQLRTPLAVQRGWQGSQVRPRYRYRSDDQDGQERMTIGGTSPPKAADGEVGSPQHPVGRAAHRR